MFGYQAEEVIGRNITLLIPEDCNEEEAAILGKVRKGEYVQHYEAIRIKKDGAPLAVSLTISPVRDASGTIVGASKIVRDISERKRAEQVILNLNSELEQRVRDRTAQLEAANKELEAFSYSVSHDLRAPLRHVTGFASRLAEDAGPGLGDKSRHYLAQIVGSAVQMGCLIDDLLTFSRMGRAELRRGPVDLGQLVNEAIKRLQPETNGREIQWQQGPLIEVQADAGMLRQAVLNLLSNAVKYTRPRRPAEIEIGCDDTNPEETVVYVRDNGVGFDMAYAGNLFGVFQRLHLDEEFEGTGIGLASVRRIIARHGGRTWAEGKLNAVATFYFSIPKAKHPAPINERT
jgi:PAS domain S-box-containing protein